MRRHTLFFNFIRAGLIASLLTTGHAYAQPGGDSGQSGERRGPPPFAELDLDSDSIITLDEFQQHEIPRGDHSSIFSAVDTDSDGQITEEEWSSHKPPKRARN